MDFILVGPGRAGQALSIRLAEVGHRMVGVLARDPAIGASISARFDATHLDWDEVLPVADLLVVAVRDDAISDVAARLATKSSAVAAAIHLSGLAPTTELAAFEDQMIGSFHPLQTLPTPEAGAARLEGAWVAITARDDYLADRLFELAQSAGMHGFELDDDAKALYHAGAAAAANYPLAALAMSRRLLTAAGVPFEAAGPLVRAVVENALDLGPVEALTGPIARGDVGTVQAQVAAVAETTPDLLEAFLAWARATAAIAGTEQTMQEVLG